MSKLFLILIFCLKITFFYSQSNAQVNGNSTPEYTKIIEIYKLLDLENKNAKLIEYGTTDAGLPLHLFVIDNSQKFDPLFSKQNNIATILINNGIHPGESCGIDASIQFAQDLLLNKDSLKSILENVVICIIPIYNIGGALNRGCCSRANQNGPEEYGFRGNSKNLDLNRDFIKCDSKEAKVFSAIFHQWNPELLIDTHVSNGADYQHSMTIINTIPERLNKVQGNLLKNELLPYLFTNMERVNYPLSPYVNTITEIPDDGITAFLDNPRFATGYASLFNTIGITTEAHMLKPYRNQVESTYYMLRSISFFARSQHKLLCALKKSADMDVASQKVFDVNFIIDTTKYELFQFSGFEANYKVSNVTKLQRLYYDRNKPFKKSIKLFNNHKASSKISLPEYYIIPQAYNEVVELLTLNNIVIEKLAMDTAIDVEVSYIDSYNDVEYAPYENHYLHFNTKIKESMQLVKFYKGDFLVKTNQRGNHFIAETLEPTACDSYFNWNFFDGILQQKEWFSPYVFEDLADSILRNDKNLEANFRQKQSNDSTFASSQWEQLYYIYKNSIYYEKTCNRYPIARIRNKNLKIKTEIY
jgi:Zinc carboxypeptidase